MVGEDRKRHALIKVVIEAWVGEDPGEPFMPVSPVRSRAELAVEPGTKVGELLGQLASRCQSLQEKVSGAQEGQLRGDLLILINGVLVSKIKALETTLNDGDEVRLVPIYLGG